MEDTPEIALKTLCCTCLSNDRKLSQLCRINDGVNNLYSLLSYDSEAYREGFYKEAASLFICWECAAIMQRIASFRRQACVAQKQLSVIAEGRDLKSKSCLSRLLCCHKHNYDFTIISDIQETDNFIDCGPEIKTETDMDDIPLSELHDNCMSDNDCHIEENDVKEKKIIEEKIKVKTKRKKLNKSQMNKVTNKKRKRLKKDDYFNYKDYFVTTEMGEEKMLESRVKRKMEESFVAAAFKCESCVEIFKSQISLARHNEDHHVEKPNHVQCLICLSYIKNDSGTAHKSEHCSHHSCLLCDQVCYSMQEINKHLKVHKHVKRKKIERPGKIGSGATGLPADVYPCPECSKYFQNKNQRWKHVQRHHREGYTCATCGKRFAFKNNLARHEQVHRAPPPRQQCPSCNKLVRVDLLKIHARIHQKREQFECVECAKSFVSRASYEHHLKYTQAHANKDILKYKCSVCEKGYRSRGELRDHVNYQHIGQTQHKCPVCGKALATRRCITRHVRRAHHGLKEGPRDKVCQQCGKAFRDKKGLREHEFIHTGERPLSCELCGCTFRQSASLYTHKKRVHKICPPRRTVNVVAPNASGNTVENATTE
ncbi:zinc finger protein 14-like [Cydia splendana]|uniref:zinc finger protein 14-like n=1 Tax=Cydia splendana TaxID=1100963 RepID=UPI00213DA3A1